MKKTFLLSFALILLSLSGAPTWAQSPKQCDRLAFQKAQAQLGFAKLFAEYPFTTAGLLLCISSAAEQPTQSDKIGVFAGCSITVCLFSSMENCAHVAVTTATLTFRLSSNADSRRALGCAE